MLSVKQYIKNPKFGQGDEPEFLPVGTTGIDAVKNRLLQVERQELNITIRDKKNYASLTEAIAAVTDDKYKVKGFQLQFSTDGKVWKTYLYNSDDASGWSSEGNWLEVTYGEGGSSTHTLDLSPLFDEEGSPVATVSDEFLAEVKKAYEEKYSNVIGVPSSKDCFPLTITKDVNIYHILFNLSGVSNNNVSLIYTEVKIDSSSKSASYSVDLTQIIKSGSGTKALTDNGRYVEFVPEAPADGKTYGRNNKQWIETSGGGTQYLDLSMFSSESGTLSEEDYQKVVKAYEDRVSFGSLAGIYFGHLFFLYDGESSYEINFLYVNKLGESPIRDVEFQVLKFIVSTDKTYKGEQDIFPYTLKKTGSGTKALTDNGQYVEFVPEAPADGKTYGRNNKQWVEASGGGTQYLDLSMFSAESGTLSEEDYQKIVKAYKDKVNVGVSDSNYQNIIIQDTGSSYTIIYFIIGLFSTGGIFIIQSLTVDIIKETKAYTSKVDFIQILKSGKGTKALTDNGEYAEFASPIKTQDGGTGTVTKELQPNTFYKFGECSSLTITLAAEKSGILNEYMFEFISGSTPTTLADIPNIKWQNGDKLVPETDCIYQVSIVNNCAVYAKFPNA